MSIQYMTCCQPDTAKAPGVELATMRGEYLRGDHDLHTYTVTIIDRQNWPVPTLCRSQLSAT